EAVCRYLGRPVGQARLRTFSDGAIEVRIGENVRGRDTVVVDDVVFTGGTLCNLAEWLARAGARSVRAVVTHALLTGDAVARIEASPFAQVLVTDTVPLPPAAEASGRVRVVSVAPLFAEA